MLLKAPFFLLVVYLVLFKSFDTIPISEFHKMDHVCSQNRPNF